MWGQCPCKVCSHKSIKAPVAALCIDARIILPFFDFVKILERNLEKALHKQELSCSNRSNHPLAGKGSTKRNLLS